MAEILSRAPGAVFLSYASQDAEAARKLRDALQAAGVEVWFDQSELRGGDAWDAKIRRQIRECGLFVAIISENTQQRPEGYFRLEWRLAEQRTHLMGRDKAFLLPICIDGTRDTEADVPDGFLAVQWTRLPGGEPTPAVVARIRALLGAEPPAAAAPPSAPPVRVAASPPRRRRGGPAQTALAAAGLIVIAALACVLWLRRPAPPAGAAPSSSAIPAEAVSDIAKTRRILANINYTRTDLELAGQYMQQATEAAPYSAEAWALRGYVQATFILRNWDFGAKRLSDTQSFCQQALALDPQDTEAMLGLAILMVHQGADADAEALMRSAIKISPDDARLHRELGIAIWFGGRPREGIAYLRATTRRFPTDPLAWYDLGLYLSLGGDQTGALTAYRQVVRLAPCAGAYSAIAEYLARAGDIAGAEAALAEIPIANRSDDRTVGTEMWLGLDERQPDRVMEAGGRTAHDYFDDAIFRGPKAFLVALACHLAAKPALEAEEWDEGIRVLRQRLAAQPLPVDEVLLAVGLAWQGSRKEAAQIMSAIEPAQREMEVSPLNIEIARYFAAIGDAPDACHYLRTVPPGVLRWQHNEVWFERIRSAPEFRALFGGP